LSSEHVERRLAAILAADVAGSCRLIGIDEEGTLAQLKALRKTLFDPKVAEHHGRVVKNTGDGALVEFASPILFFDNESTRWSHPTPAMIVIKDRPLEFWIFKARADHIKNED
jgi:class 3 adenylate cyclase